MQDIIGVYTCKSVKISHFSWVSYRAKYSWNVLIDVVWVCVRVCGGGWWLGWGGGGCVRVCARVCVRDIQGQIMFTYIKKTNTVVVPGVHVFFIFVLFFAFVFVLTWMHEQTVSGSRSERTHKHTDNHNIQTMETKQDNAPFMCFYILSSTMDKTVTW